MVTIVGGGQWGQALGQLIQKSHPISFLLRNANHPHIAPKLITNQWKADSILLYAAPAKVFPQVIMPVLKSPPEMIIITSKGLFEYDHQIWFYDDWLRAHNYMGEVVFLSGPSFAGEVKSGAPTVVNVCCQNIDTTLTVMNLFKGSNLLCRQLKDVKGIQLMGVFKNILAILIGWLSAKQCSSNSLSAVMVQMIHEMMRLIESLGGHADTVYEYAGIGDVILTASSNQSRNFRFGQLIANGLSVADAKDAIGEVVEGESSLNTLTQLLKQHALSSKLASTTHELLSNNMSLDESFKLIFSDYN